MRTARAVAAVAVAAAAALTPPAAAEAAKKKKPKPPVATVNGTFTVRYDDPQGFGNDDGPKWQQLKVVIKDAKIPFRGDNRSSAAAEVDVRFEYKAEAHTGDRSWSPGCDREDRETYGGWSDKTTVTVRETRWLQTNGRSKRYLGWEVFATPPENGIYTVSRGSYQEWESLLMENCLTVPINEPLGGWTPAFANPDGLGKLSSDNRSVPLTATNTGVDQTGKATGSIKFSRAIAD